MVLEFRGVGVPWFRGSVLQVEEKLVVGHDGRQLGQGPGLGGVGAVRRDAEGMANLFSVEPFGADAECGLDDVLLPLV